MMEEGGAVDGVNASLLLLPSRLISALATTAIPSPPPPAVIALSTDAHCAARQLSKSHVTRHTSRITRDTQITTCSTNNLSIKTVI